MPSHRHLPADSNAPQWSLLAWSSRLTATILTKCLAVPSLNGKRFPLSSILQPLFILLFCSCDPTGYEVEFNEPVSADSLFVVEEGSAHIFTGRELASAATLDSRLRPLFIAGNPLGWDIDGYKDKVNEGRYYKTVVIRYPSTDTRGRRIWLSGRLYMGCSVDGRIRIPLHTVLSCHFTIAKADECPSKSYTMDAGLAFNYGLVVCPDYMGFGASEDRVHPYCIAELTAVNAIDMVRAARSYVEACGRPLSRKLPFYIVGYSQGGAAALAVHKYIEEHQLLKEFPITNTYCGGGPYSMETILESYVDNDYCGYPLAIPYILLGLKETYPGILTRPLEEFLTSRFNECGLMGLVEGKQMNSQDICTAIRDSLKPGATVGIETSLMLSEEAMDKESELYQQLHSATLFNELAEGWAPTRPVHFFHYAKDEIVAIDGFLKARENLANEQTYFEKVDCGSLLTGHLNNGGLFYARAISGEYLKVMPSGANF